MLEDLELPALAGMLGKKSEADVDAAAVELMRLAGLTPAGKMWLRDGRSGERFASRSRSARSTCSSCRTLSTTRSTRGRIGPYSLVTQQPLAGKAQFGGQRFGEMEVWALEAYGAAHTLQEILTVKSDDVNGRSRVYEAIVKGQNLPEPGIPESFNVLVKELQAFGIKVTMGQSETGFWGSGVDTGTSGNGTGAKDRHDGDHRHGHGELRSMRHSTFGVHSVEPPGQVALGGHGEGRAAHADEQREQHAQGSRRWLRRARRVRPTPTARR